MVPGDVILAYDEIRSIGIVPLKLPVFFTGEPLAFRLPLYFTPRGFIADQDESPARLSSIDQDVFHRIVNPVSSRMAAHMRDT